MVNVVAAAHFDASGEPYDSSKSLFVVPCFLYQAGGV